MVQEVSNMETYNFRLTGVPPEQAMRSISVYPETSTADIKKMVYQEYKLNPILHIQFIFKGQIIPDTSIFSKIGIHSKEDTITVMATQAGGSMPSVDFIMDFESGSSSYEEILKNFQQMIDSGIVWKLQGSYGRMAHHLLEKGLCYSPHGNFTKEQVQLNVQDFLADEEE